MREPLPLSAASIKVRQNTECLAALFDFLPHTFLFVKNIEHQFVRCNRALWLLNGLESECQMLGKTDSDFFPPKLAAGYVDEDRKVMRTGQRIENAVWLVTNSKSSRWYYSTKIPVTTHGDVIGLAGILSPYEGSGEVPQEYERIKRSLALADREFASGIKVSDLAAESGLSVNQFTRIFRDLFHMTPGDYVLRLKLDCAARMLSGGDSPITTIALQSGFYDHSALSKQFKKRNGMTPREYRNQYSEGNKENAL